jgi:oxygen-dependent protoporphyrinogen oxidase
VVVVGGGITGLAAAWAIVQSAPTAHVTVLERASQLGGHLRVGDLGGIPVDLGPESMVASRPEAVLLARQVGIETELVAPANTRMGVWVRGAVRVLPRGQYLGIPTDLQALAASEILSLPGMLRIPLDRVRAATPPIPDASVGEFIAGRLGREVVDSVVDPLLGVVYAGRADDLSLAATMPALFRAMKRERSLLRATAEITAGGAANAGARRGAPFRGIVGGVGRLPGVVAAALVTSGVQLHTDTTVRALERRPDGWRLTVGPASAPTFVNADAVIVAVPPGPASRLLGGVCPDAAEALGRIEHASVAVVDLAFPAAGLPALPDLSAVLVPSTAGRAVKSVTFSDVKWHWIAARARAAGVRVLRVNLGRAGETAILARSDPQLLELVSADLEHILGIRTPPVATLVARWGGALPQYRVGHRDLVGRIREAIDVVPGLDVAGAAFDGVGIAACIGSANEAVRRVLSDLERIRTLRGGF